MMFNRWPSLLLSLAILIGVGVCFRRFDFMLMNEVKALISVVFGFVTSCLLLSFIWIIQKRPLHSSWPIQNTSILDTPSMHPRGRSSSTEQQRQATICTVASLLDQPPNYEDALINSKPVNWMYLNSEKNAITTTINNDPSQSTSYPQLSSSSCQTSIQHERLCAKHSNEPTNNTTVHLSDITTSRECCICMEELISSAVLNKNSTSNSMAQLALSIVRGFTTLERTGLTGRLPQDSCNHMENTHIRKISYSQLDVSQLMVSGSPPKYCELSLGGSVDNNNLNFNNSNEPRAGYGG